jgi:Putative heavy-metal-binding
VGAGADAVVGLRFDCSEITQSLSEVAAYGTAVTLIPVMTDAAETSSGDQAESGDRGDQLSNDETMRNWPPSSWPSSEPQAPSSGS